MSKHPGNPFWHQERDQPILIYRQDWDEAVKAGWVTAEHILIRIIGMLEHARGPQDVDFIAYDAEGFVVALTAASVRKDGIELRVNPNDHNPPHAHIVVPGVKGKLTIDLETFKIDQDLPDGWSKKGKAIEAMARANEDKLLDWWNTYHSAA